MWTFYMYIFCVGKSSYICTFSSFIHHPSFLSLSTSNNWVRCNEYENNSYTGIKFNMENFPFSVTLNYYWYQIWFLFLFSFNREHLMSHVFRTFGVTCFKSILKDLNIQDISQVCDTLIFYGKCCFNSFFPLLINRWFFFLGRSSWTTLVQNFPVLCNYIDQLNEEAENPSRGTRWLTVLQEGLIIFSSVTSEETLCTFFPYMYQKNMIY